MFIEVPSFSETSPALKNSWLRACNVLYNNVNSVLENVPHDLLSFSDDNNDEENETLNL